MKHRCTLLGVSLLVAALPLPSSVTAAGQADAGWVTLFDGTNLDQWNTIGDANWKLTDGVVHAEAGTGFLVTKSSYADFELRAEFWADTHPNSGIFLRWTVP
jgi:hypothetical protein